MCVSISETVTIPNDGFVDSNDIIHHGLSLVCHTNKTTCCHSNVTEEKQQLGDWYYPNKTAVQSFSVSRRRGIPVFFARSRSQSKVTLYVYRNKTYLDPPERGRFYCTIPDASDVEQTLYVNIGKNRRNHLDISNSKFLHAYAVIYYSGHW